MNTSQESLSLPPVAPIKNHVTTLNARTLTKVLEIGFDDGQFFSIPFELMRVYSPSAEVRGHGVGQEILQLGKRWVNVNGIEPIGNYAIKPIFDDGHISGIFTWAYLYWLGCHQDLLWKNYLSRLQAAGFLDDTGRDQDSSVKTGKNCHS